MLSGKQYVPILRCKPAELEALGGLEPQDRSRILPLLEPLPKSFEAPKDGPRKGKEPAPEEVFAKLSRDILRHWGNDPFLLDFQHVGSIGRIHGLHPAVFAAQQFRLARLRPVLVCHLSDPAEVQLAVKDVASVDSRGTCLRVVVAEALQRDFSRRIHAFLDMFGLPQSSVDLQLDYQTIPPSSPTFSELFSRVPEIRAWRTVIVSGGVFPENLMDFVPDRHVIPRRDWIFYRDQILNERLVRNPIFSDYTVQFGLYKEPPGNSNPSASIRYAFEDSWVLMRGHGLFTKDKNGRRKGPGHEQYPALAQLLCESDDFCGATFSAGDTYLYQKYLKVGGHGTPRTFLRAGINHHMTYVVRQFAGADLRAVPTFRGDRPVESIRPSLRSRS